MRSKKQHIRLWYECLQICHSLPEYSENLTKSSAFYSDWGDVAAQSFDDWWKLKSYLFDDAVVREVSRASKSPDTITLSIPLNEKPSVILREVKKIVDKKQAERFSDPLTATVRKKSKVVSSGKYALSQKEIKGVFHYINLEMYKIYLSLGRPPINRDFLLKVRRNFDSRTNSKLRETILHIPSVEDFEKTYQTNASVDDVIRSVRRSLKSVEKTLFNVSLGVFP
ncbi:hypothetical protein LSUCC1028_00355 [Rhodobacterales bacterium LSUCC1028]|nr:hypothetical protein [Rhodobacterales bacterium LSUCC1028]